MKKNKQKKVKTQNKNPILIFILVGVLIVGLIGYFVLRKPSTEPGIQYIQEQEDAKIDKVAKKVHNIRMDELMSAVDSGQLDAFSMFDDFAFFGDSRTMGFYTYGFLPTSRVFAGSGNTILNIPDWLDKLKTLMPSTIYFSYGVNDMGLGLNHTEEGYGKLYEERVKQVQEICPDAQIFLLSIIPATPEACASSPAWKEYKEYNKEVKRICKENGWHYVDCTSLAKNGSADIYQGDGIHFYSGFYKEWATKIIEATQEVQ